VDRRLEAEDRLLGVPESRLEAAAYRRRAQEAGSRRAAATLAAEAGSPGSAVVERPAAYRRLRRMQHLADLSRHTLGI
jgi:hypothetical protein